MVRDCRTGIERHTIVLKSFNRCESVAGINIMVMEDMQSKNKIERLGW